MYFFLFHAEACIRVAHEWLEFRRVLFLSAECAAGDGACSTRFCARWTERSTATPSPCPRPVRSRPSAARLPLKDQRRRRGFVPWRAIFRATAISSSTLAATSDRPIGGGARSPSPCSPDRPPSSARARRQSEHRRVGKEWVRTCSTRWSPYP